MPILQAYQNVRAYTWNLTHAPPATHFTQCPASCFEKAYEVAHGEKPFPCLLPELVSRGLLFVY